MDISAIDRSAISGDSTLHRASTTSKLAALALLLLAVIASSNPLVLASVALALVSVGLVAGLRMRLLGALAFYPVLFAAIFALASAPSVLVAVTIVLRSMTAALAVVTLVLTTPYPSIFAKSQVVLPRLAGDALLMTYRTFFLLAERFSHLLTAIRLRSARMGRESTLSWAKAVSSALGNTLLYALDLAERDYDVLMLRGYSGRLRVAPPLRRSAISDSVVIALSALACAVALVWQAGSTRLLAYSWFPLTVSVGLLAAASIRRWARARAIRTA